jgi:CelD/BcsL family acetyltransferase involved in cellulose biosynthesis
VIQLPSDSQDPRGLRLRVLSAAERPAVALAWRQIQDRLGVDSLTCSWDWTATWLQQFGSVVPHRFALAERGGVPCAAALLTCTTERYGPLRVRRLYIGTAGEPPAETVYVEYNRLLVSAEDRAPFVKQLLSKLRSDPSWDELRLNGFAPEDAEPFLQSDRSLAARRVRCLAADLATDSGDVVATLKSGTRQRIRRSLRGFGSVRTEWAETTSHALEILDELIALHQQRWEQAGRAGAFSGARFRGFHRELIQHLLPSKQVILFRARSEQGTIGCLYSFVERGSVHFYQSGLAAFDDNRLKPGLTVHALCMQACHDLGLVEYNFLAGDDRYKQELGSVERELIWASLRRPRASLYLLDRVRTARRWALRTGARKAPESADDTT